MSLLSTMVVVHRTVWYQGTIPMVEYGYKCVCCRNTFWPAWPGDNTPVRAYCTHVRPTRCPVMDIVVYPKRDMTDF